MVADLPPSPAAAQMVLSAPQHAGLPNYVVSSRQLRDPSGIVTPSDMSWTTALWGFLGAAISVMLEYVEAHHTGSTEEMLNDWKRRGGRLALIFKGVIGAVVAVLVVDVLPPAFSAFVAGGGAVYVARQIFLTGLHGSSNE